MEDEVFGVTVSARLRETQADHYLIDRTIHDRIVLRNRGAHADGRVSLKIAIARLQGVADSSQ
jgi:hypothetical protein